MSLLTQASLIMTPNAVKQSKVYSIIPTNGDGDLTFTRGTAATSTLSGADGLIEIVPYNLLTYSEQFDNAAWIKTRCTITSNSTTSPNGTLTADTLVGDSIAGDNYVFLSQNATIGVPNVLSVYVKPISITSVKLVSFTQSGQAWFSLIGLGSITFETGICTNSTIESLPNGWYRISTKITPTATGSNNIGISNIGGGVIGNLFYLWGGQLVQGSVPKDYFFTTDRLNVPRLNYDVAGGCPSLLLEPQRTNLVINSVWAGGAVPTGWSQFTTGGTLTPTTSIKNPNVTAFNFAGTASRNFISQTQTFTNGYIYAISFYVESVTTTAFLDTIIGTTVVTGSSTYLKNNVTVTASTEAIAAGNTYTLIYAATSTSVVSTFRIGLGTNGNSTANFTISMPQMEIGASNTASYSTSFIPTTTGALTRNADVFSRNNIFSNNLITSAGGTWFFELNNNLSLIRDASSSSLYIDTSSSGVTNGFSIKHTTGGSTLRLQIVKYIIGASSLFYQTLTNTVKIAIKWNGVTADIFVNGSKVISATAFTTTNMEFLGGNGGDVPKYIKSILLFPTPLTDAECIALTQ
jgi:hypothetical protein